MIRLLISTGEVSGDLQGGLLIEALHQEAYKRSLQLEVIALGGPRMQSAGAELIANTAPMGAIGLWEALPLVIPTLKLQARVDKFLQDQQLDLVVLIDYMGPNIRLGNRIKNRMPDLPIVYYIAPQEWAWRVGEGGTTDLISFSDTILAIFEKEAEFYSGRGGNVTWVGHPMLDTFKDLVDQNQAREVLGLKPNEKVLLLFPASRKQELRYIMPTLAATASRLQKKDPSLKVFVPAGLSSFEEPLNDALKASGVVGKVIPAKKVDEFKPYLFSVADLALGKSGTVNMELALNNVPQLVGYRVSRVTAFLARKVLNFEVDHISPVNLLLKERLIPELVQDDFNVDTLFKLAMPLLSNPEVRLPMLEGYKRLKKKLGEPGVTNRAANAILDLVVS